MTPNPTFAAIQVGSGATQIDQTYPAAVSVTISLPPGWESIGPGVYRKPDPAGRVGISVGVYQIEHVNMFPCRWSSGRFTDTAYPHTIAGLAEALSAFWGQDPDQTPFFSNSALAPIATKPAPATFGGYPASRLQILIPSTFDFSACDGGQLVLWQTTYDTVRTGLGPGEIDRLWVVGAHGGLVVVDAALPLLATPAQENELQAAVDSVRIGP